MNFIIDTFIGVIGACTVTHNVLFGLLAPSKKDKKGHTVYKIRPHVEYGREYINQIEMLRHIFNDHNLRRNRQADESRCDNSMTNIFARPTKKAG